MAAGSSFNVRAISPRDRGATGGRDDFVGPAHPDMSRKRDRDASALTSPPVSARFAAIAGDAHERLERGRYRGRRPGDRPDQLGQRVPLRLPSAESALVLLRHRGPASWTRGPGARIAAASATFAANGIPLLRHRGRPAAPVRRCFASLVDFGLREQRDIPGDLAERAGREAQGVARFTRRSRCACHGTSGTRRSSLRAERFGHDAIPRPTERGERSRLRRRTAGPARSSRACARSHPAPPERVDPARGLEPESDRRGVLQPRPARHAAYRRAVAPAHGPAGGARAGRPESRGLRRGAEARGPVSMTSWLVAPQWT